MMQVCSNAIAMERTCVIRTNYLNLDRRLNKVRSRRLTLNTVLHWLLLNVSSWSLSVDHVWSVLWNRLTLNVLLGGGRGQWDVGVLLGSDVVWSHRGNWRVGGRVDWGTDLGVVAGKEVFCRSMCAISAHNSLKTQNYKLKNISKCRSPRVLYPCPTTGRDRMVFMAIFAVFDTLSRLAVHQRLTIRSRSKSLA